MDVYMCDRLAERFADDVDRKVSGASDEAYDELVASFSDAIFAYVASIKPGEPA